MAREEFVNCHFQTDLWTVRLHEEIPSWSAENDFRWLPGVAPSIYGHTSDASPSAGPGSPSRSMNPSASSHPEDADRRQKDRHVPWGLPSSFFIKVVQILKTKGFELNLMNFELKGTEHHSPFLYYPGLAKVTKISYFWILLVHWPSFP